ncbi:MAG: RNA methyltransferase, partial [Rubricoccaceae bacterium]|nr:RNA methyltransferase [Rubricoccaceae bacterium]
MPPPSRQRLKDLAGLARRKGRRALGRFLVEGVRAVEAALAAGAAMDEVLVTAKAAESPRVRAMLERSEAPVHTVPARDLARITDVQHGQGVVAVAHAVVREDATALDGARALLVLDGVQDPGNVGTLIRTAAWFSADAVLCGPGTADPESPKGARSAAGALWDLALVRLHDAADYAAALDGLRARGLALWGADLDGAPAAVWAPPPGGALVLGSEGHGLSAEAAARLDGRVRIAVA